MKALSLEGKLAIGKLKIANARLSDVRVEARAKEGLLTLNPLSAALYSGVYKGNVTVDARTGPLRLSLDELLTGVQAGPLLKDLQGRSLLTGLANATVKVSAVGATNEALTQTLAGNVNFQLKDGSLEGIDILGKICRALEAVSLGSFKKEDLVGGLLQMAVKPAKGEAAEAGGRTAFSEMHGSMTFSDGVGRNDDLLLQSPLLRVEGAGKLDLPKKRVDYKATAALVKSCEGQGGKSFRELANYAIPVTITGPLDKPDVKPDLTAGIIEMLTRKQPQEPAAAPSAPKQPGQQAAAAADYTFGFGTAGAADGSAAGHAERSEKACERRCKGCHSKRSSGPFQEEIASSGTKFSPVSVERPIGRRKSRRHDYS